tara:strand:- start:365 stop:883 length:519 start_codon:yes stop_codon:yes gene_type:complete
MKKRIRIYVLIAFSICLAAAPLVVPFPIKLTYNASASAPIGFYRIKAAGELKRGVYTVVPTPPGFRLLAAKRHYLPQNIPLIKRVVGLPGDAVCRHGRTVFVNQKPVAEALLRDSQGRDLPVWQGCFVLKPDQFFALMEHPESFDGRYFGPLNTADIVGIAVPLITWEPEDA